jgi:biotin carboxyl carrier protein
MAETLSIVIGRRTARVDRSDGGLSVDNAAVDVVYGPVRGEVVLRHDDRQNRAFVVRSAEGTWVFHRGRTYLASVEAEGTSPRRLSHGPGSLRAPMPATVVSVNARPGDSVKAGDVLILLEAMKMELPLRAPGDAVVSAVHCRPGDLVQPNVPLVDLDAPGTK